MIDYKTEELDPIFKEFNVLHTERVDPTFVKAMSDDTVIILWLIGFNVFQGLLIILILTLCYNQRAKYKRRLKAATIGNSIISDTLLQRKNIVSSMDQSKPSSAKKRASPHSNSSVPNTNKHASEGSNPVWMTNVAYDNMTFEDEDVTDDLDDLDDNYLERAADNLDSLDVNVLNIHNNSNTLNHSDDGYAGSTLRVGSSMNKTLMSVSMNHGMDSKMSMANGQVLDSRNNSPRRLRSHSQSRSSEVSSGLGSGNSRKFLGLHPSHMPPVEKLALENINNGYTHTYKSNAQNAKKKFYGHTTYDQDNIPRTEL